MEKKNTSRLFEGLRWLFAACFGLAVTVIVSMRYPVPGTILLLGGIAFLCCRYRLPRFGLLLFGFSLLVHLAALACITTPIQSDFAVQYKAAQQFAAGDFSFQKSWYFQRWGYQTGLVIYEGLLLKLWNSPLFLRLVNCVLAAGTNVLIYVTAKDYFSRQAAQTVSIAYALFLFPATLVTVLCNNIPSAFFLYLGLFLLLGKRFQAYPRPAVYAVSGACLAVGNALRPDAAVVLVPVAVYFLFRFFSRFTLKNLKYYLKRALALFLTFALLSAGMSGLVKLTGVNASGLGNADPLWGVVVGTNPESRGRYNKEDGDAVKEKQNSGMERKDAEKELIREHLDAPPAKLLELLLDKVEHFWWDRSLAWSMSSVRENYPRLYGRLEEIDGAFFTCALFLAALGAVMLFRKKQKDFKLYLFPFIVFSAFAVYLLLEVQPRYAYTVQIAVFLLAAGGVEAVLSGFHSLRGRLSPAEKGGDEPAV